MLTITQSSCAYVVICDDTSVFVRVPVYDYWLPPFSLISCFWICYRSVWLDLCYEMSIDRFLLFVLTQRYPFMNNISNTFWGTEFCIIVFLYDNKQVSVFMWWGGVRRSLVGFTVTSLCESRGMRSGNCAVSPLSIQRLGICYRGVRGHHNLDFFPIGALASVGVWNSSRNWRGLAC